MAEQNYFAVIGDIKRSRAYPNREDIQKKMKRVLDQVNHDFADEIAAKFLITLGDEFQGLLRSPARLLRIIDEIRYALYPVQLRISIGIGAIRTPINPDQAIGADGPAFYAARRMMDEIRKDEAGKESMGQDIKLASQTGGTTEDLINVILGLSATMESSWTQKQFEAVSILMYTPLSQREAAEKLNIEESSVQRRLKSADFYAYRNARAEITRALIAEWGNHGA